MAYGVSLGQYKYYRCALDGKKLDEGEIETLLQPSTSIDKISKEITTMSHIVDYIDGSLHSAKQTDYLLAQPCQKDDKITALTKGEERKRETRSYESTVSAPNPNAKFQFNGTRMGGKHEIQPSEIGEFNISFKNSSLDSLSNSKVSQEKELSTDCENVIFKPSRCPQIFAALAANFGAFALGAVLSWTATALPDLRESGQIGKISKSEESWIGSIMTLGAVFSCPFAGWGIEKFGRRMSMLILTAPFVGGWLLIAFAQNILMIYVGRFVTGFCAGAYSIATPVYITETADRKIRGALASGFDMMLTVGILYIFLIGTYASWSIQALACGAIPLATHLLMMFVPESPRYLLEKGKEAEASVALCWLRGASSSQQVEEELSEMVKSVDDSHAKKGSWRDFTTSPVLKPLLIGVALMAFQQLSGIDAVMFYTVDIFRSSGSEINENLSTNIVGIIQVAATTTAALVVDRSGRRFLLFISAFFMVLSLGTMGLFFHLKKMNGDVGPEGLGWLPLASLVVYVVAFSIGFGPIPWLIMGEILPGHVKGTASGIVTITRWILGFVVTLVFQDLMSLLGEDGGYWLFGTFCLVALFVVYFCVPETKGKTLDEIQLIFNKTDQPEAL